MEKRKRRSQKEADLADDLNSDYRARRRMAKRERSRPKKAVRIRIRVKPFPKK